MYKSSYATVHVVCLCFEPIVLRGFDDNMGLNLMFAEVQKKSARINSSTARTGDFPPNKLHWVCFKTLNRLISCQATEFLKMATIGI